MRWINVKKRLPENEWNYLVAQENGNVSIMYYLTRDYPRWSSQFGTVKNGSDGTNGVTHWMKIPKHPHHRFLFKIFHRP